MDDIRDIELTEIIREANVYNELLQTAGWKLLEKEILDRTASLSRVLLTENDDKKIYRTQGEVLGIQSILNIVEAKVQDGELAQQEIKMMEENNGKEED